VVSELVFGFRGTPLLLRVWLDLDRSSLSWVCDKPGFSGSFCCGDSSIERGMASSSRIEIEKFNGKKFELWKLKMEDLLVDKEQWIVVDPGTQPTGTPSTSTQATGHILYLSENNISTVNSFLGFWVPKIITFHTIFINNKDTFFSLFIHLTTIFL
jgi:hypothetical protein